jgi:putative transposase
VTSKNGWQQEALPSVTKPSETVVINGVLHYLWRAVGRDGDEIDILIKKRKDKKVTRQFFRKSLKGQQAWLIKIVTAKLRSYSAANKELIPDVEHSTKQYENNRCELSIIRLTSYLTLSH